MCLNSKGQVETPLFPCSSIHLGFCFFHSFCNSFLIRSVGGPSSLCSNNLPHPHRLQYSSQSAEYMNGNQSVMDMWQGGKLFFFFFNSSCPEKELDSWQEGEICQSMVTSPTPHEKRKKKKSTKKKERKRRKNRERRERRHHAICSLSIASQMWSGT